MRLSRAGSGILGRLIVTVSGSIPLKNRIRVGCLREMLSHHVSSHVEKEFPRGAAHPWGRNSPGIVPQFLSVRGCIGQLRAASEERFLGKKIVVTYQVISK